MAQKVVEAGYKGDIPFVTVEEGVYPNIHRTTFKGDNIPEKFKSDVVAIVEEEKEDEDIAPKKDPSDLLESLI